MDVKCVTPFIEALERVLHQFGVSDIKRGNLQGKKNMQVNLDITSVIGLVGDIRGNVGYSLSEDTAKKIVALMLDEGLVSEIDFLARSTIGELTNMITGTAATLLYKNGIKVDITPPSIIIGKDILLLISTVQTLAVDMETEFGKIEINLGLEM